MPLPAHYFVRGIRQGILPHGRCGAKDDAKRREDRVEYPARAAWKMVQGQDKGLKPGGRVGPDGLGDNTIFRQAQKVR